MGGHRRAPVDYDVFICYRDGPDRDRATTLAAGLAARGFRVFAESRSAEGADTGRRLEIIAGAPDFVLLLRADTFDPTQGRDPMREEVGRALADTRNLVAVRTAGEESGRLPDDLRGVATGHQVVYAPDCPTESIARVAHCLSSDIEERTLLRRFKRLAQVAALVLLAGLATQAVPSLIKAWKRPKPLPPLAPFALYWTGFGQRPGNGEWTEFDIANDVALQPGDQIPPCLQPERRRLCLRCQPNRARGGDGPLSERRDQRREPCPRRPGLRGPGRCSVVDRG